MEAGVPVAVVTVVLLAILAFFVFQNRKQKQRLIQLQNERAGDPLRHVEMREQVEDVLGELDETYHELTQPDAPQHEIVGNGIYDLFPPCALEHELA